MHARERIGRMLIVNVNLLEVEHPACFKVASEIFTLHIFQLFGLTPPFRLKWILMSNVSFYDSLMRIQEKKISGMIFPQRQAYC